MKGEWRSVSMGLVLWVLSTGEAPLPTVQRPSGRSSSDRRSNSVLVMKSSWSSSPACEHEGMRVQIRSKHMG